MREEKKAPHGVWAAGTADRDIDAGEESKSPFGIVSF